MASVRQLATNFTGTGVVSPWLRLDNWEGTFSFTALISLDLGTVGTFNMAYIADDISRAALRQVSVSQATTVITVTDGGPNLTYGAGLGHGLAVGDFYELEDGYGIKGIYSVASVPSVNTITLTSPTSQTVPPHLAYALGGRVVLAGGTGDGVFPAAAASITAKKTIATINPISAVQLQGTAITTPGVARLVVLQAAMGS